ncbi:MAG: thrombospondin type 3 repeat-containing protein, partial [Pseudomonadota bacterium]
YSCQTEAGEFQVIHNGEEAIASRGRNTRWNFSPTNPDAPGIDWNCDGVIQTEAVSSNIDGPGMRSDDYWDVERWTLERVLTGVSEWDKISNPTRCQVSYFARCDAPERSCYRWPQAYRDAIPTLATGKPPIDCRALFLENRDCPEIPESSFPTATCPLVDPETPRTDIAWSWSLAGDDHHHGPNCGHHHGPLTVEELIGREDGEGGSIPGDVENCDWVDNDGDGLIDEGCADSDSDGIPDVLDNCAGLMNADQADRDRNGLGDACQFPTIQQLAGTWDGQRSIDLFWESADGPNRGYVIHRIGERDQVARYLGSVYPTTSLTLYTDSISVPDTYTYVVRALNLDGEPGQASTVSVTADFPTDIFDDSFESESP